VIPAALLRLFAGFLAAAAVLGAEPAVRPVPDDVRAGFGLAPFYRQFASVQGLPVVGSDRVSPAAIREAVWIVTHMVGERTDLLHAMASNHVRLAVMAHDEYTTDVPEHAGLQPKVYWDRRARGLGATPEAPAVSCAEENLLCFPGDPYALENILVHEFAHAIHETGLVTVDPTFDRRLGEAYHSATNRGLWKNTYAAVNRQEYWAEGTQSWFDNNRENDSLHNHVSKRAILKEYDPALASLCREVYGDGTWRYKKPVERAPADRAHLTGYDFAKAPTFHWRPAPIPDAPRVSIQTALGDIEVELDAKAAPNTVANFLRYVHEGFYADGRFFRTVRADNQPTNAVRIAVIQAEANPARDKDAFPPIAIERTRDTGLRHRDGTISMARDGPDTATHHIFICIGDQPELDLGGKRNPDGQGFAAFGRVVKGMELVRRIHESPAKEQQLEPPVRIQRAIRLN
jgi:cyclophilin family peptidyl-prolyl cis-trans isomerase